VITRARLWLFFGFSAGIAWQFYGRAAPASRIAPRQASSPLPPVSLPKGNTAAPKFMLSSPFHRKLSPKATPFACAVVRGSGPPRRSKPTLRPSNPVLLMLISYSAKDEGICHAHPCRSSEQWGTLRVLAAPYKDRRQNSRCDSTVGAATSRVAAWARDWLLVKRFFEPAMRDWQVIRQQR
jgi:hypothetical protein